MTVPGDVVDPVAELAAARAEIARLRVHIETGIPLALLSGGDDEQIRARAAAIREWAAQAR